MAFPQLSNFRLAQDVRGLLTVAFDMTGQTHNVFNERVVAELQTLIGVLEHDAAVSLVVFTGGKKSGFCAGADVEEIHAIRSPETAGEITSIGQRLFDRVERLPMPTVAVIHGPCLGGGLEFALACRYRVARDDAATRLGFPEIEIGLLPGWSGTQRLPRLVGVGAALEMILTGRKVSARTAAKQGLVDLASPPDRFQADVDRFLNDRLEGTPCPRRRLRLGEKLRDETRLGQQLVLRTARKRTASRARHYPALSAVLKTVQRGIQDSYVEGLACERAAFADLLFTPTCRNLMEVFFDRQRARKPTTWVNDQGPTPHAIRRIAVIGAGAMGAGIAQLAAYHGLEVILNDTSEEFVHAGLKRVGALMHESVRKGLLRTDEAAARLNAVRTCVDWGPIGDVDLAVEAVTEREAIKRDVFGRLDHRLAPRALLVSNTSSLSVGRLAAATERPGQVAGLHFFNPVHRMQLVEVVRGEATSGQTVAALVRLVRQLGKTPIVVADRPGFLVNRILFPYLDEAVRMVVDGVPAEEIDRSARHFGMPMGPLELLDQVGLDVAADVARSLTSPDSDPSPTPNCLAAMVARGWTGKKSGQGFYRYRKGRRGKPTRWRGPVQPTHGDRPSSAQVSRPRRGVRGRETRAPRGDFFNNQLRLVHRMVNEAARCLQERVVAEPWAVDLGMVLGAGFAPFRGGPLRWADQYGLRRLVRSLEKLRQTHGRRFAPSRLLRTMADSGGEFYPMVEPDRIESVGGTESRAKST